MNRHSNWWVSLHVARNGVFLMLEGVVLSFTVGFSCWCPWHLPIPLLTPFETKLHMISNETLMVGQDFHCRISSSSRKLWFILTVYFTFSATFASHRVIIFRWFRLIHVVSLIGMSLRFINPNSEGNNMSSRNGDQSILHPYHFLRWIT